MRSAHRYPRSGWVERLHMASGLPSLRAQVEPREECGKARAGRRVALTISCATW